VVHVAWQETWFATPLDREFRVAAATFDELGRVRFCRQIRALCAGPRHVAARSTLWRYKWAMAPELHLGTVLAGYRIDGVLGRGGMGCVYRATQLRLERAVALKVIAAQFASDEAFRERFRREALAGAAIDHPNVLPVFEADEEDGILYLSMRLVEGESVAGLIRRQGRLDTDRAVRLAAQVAAALDAAHARGVVHRDVKPANVLVTDVEGKEHAYLTDFGLARRRHEQALTATGQLVGTLDYIAPEVLRGEAATVACDIYALGCLLFESLTGTVPYPRGSPEAMISAHLFEPVPSVREHGADVPSALDDVVRSALAKRPEERPHRAGALAGAALEGCEDTSRTTRTRRSGQSAPRDAGRPTDVRWSDGSGPRTFGQDRRRHNLRLDPGALIGRERELRDIRRLLHGGRLVTLIGPGGVGKTRLAIQAVAQAPDVFPDGVWLVELAALDAAELVLREVAGTLGARGESGHESIAWLTETLAERELLLILDNCEHLLDACAELADSLLRSCPRVAMLATSREPLRIGHERIYPVPSLSAPAPGAGFDEVAQAEAVRLFCDRAGEQAAGFALNEGNASAVAAVCRRVDGIPLAIELAAARMRSLSATDIAARLDQRFQLLTRGRRTAPHRHKTLRATFDWSFELLTDAERAVLRRLSVFAGTFGLDAAETVGAGDHIESAHVLDVVASLVDKSLVQVDLAPKSDTRYRLLETIREYASEQLAGQGEESVRAARRAHLEHYMARAETLAPELVRGAQAQHLDQLQADYDNLRAALDFAAEETEPAFGLRLAASLGEYWLRRGHLGEAIELITRALDHPRVATATREERAAACLAGAWIAGAGLDIRHSDAFANAALELLAGLETSQGERSIALAQRAMATAHSGGDVTAARHDADAALELARRTGDESLIAKAAIAKVVVERARGNIASALAWHEESAAGFRRCQDLWTVGVMLSNGADLKLTAGDRAGARRDLAEALEIADQIHARDQAALALHNLALLDLVDGDHQAAHMRATEAYTVAEERGDWVIRHWAMLDLALATGARGEDCLAATLHGAADALRGEDRLQTNEHRLREQEIQRLRSTLGEERFQMQHSKGMAMSAKEARALAEQA
jgi:serine/threonine-protein kinase PknK